ncbi:phenylalanine--tRNA ligase subunit beta [Ohtaekwangia koreensis]|uniref:Phenylalanine--tRNA ligase beta subunit n=1 Tax=Ohtaekwangia koreensis TaxID=688867 RepID=A0A1T5LTZ2_9BACT|nr:phenylalanine--tRNA ligase subunit beta [Ohtaekwangia koreensis]SKC79069.1 phenylalanyl-tRNA synthetase beta subunit [Ohtaekwangia koreensis]
MTISYNWLKEYIDIPESAEEIGKVLTSTGLEVEKVEEHETVKGGLKGLVIGTVLTCAKHPNADKLSVTTVDVGGEKILPIVCGAPNVAAGQRVVVATPGTTVYPSKGEPFTIKNSKIRGEQSEGMICAEDEIGLGESHAGIMILTTDVPNGTPAAEFFNIQSDYILEIGLTPNRADATSHVGVARDIKASKQRSIQWPSVDHFKSDNQSLVIPVEVENKEACPRYSGVTITGITVKDSPDWLKNRLLSIGLTPINNIVDITNFICYELGQPMHAFDADQITGKKVIVKTLPAGSKFTTLDNKERTLLANDLMICNAAEGMCIAGVFGGAKSGITGNTKNIFLESAYFSADYIRKTSLHHQLKTDASFRYERGTDPNITVYALKRAALLVKEIAGGQISSEIVDIYPSKIENRTIEVKDKHVARLIGKIIPREEVFGILERLDIQITEKKEDSFTVSVPPYRVDVLQEADIIEEILRIYGFNNIELSDIAGTDYVAEFPVKSIDKYKRSIGELLAGNGFYEIWTNSLTNHSYQQKHKLTFKGEPVEILNKLSEEQGILRQTLLFTGLEVCAYNINRKQKDLKLYEFGKIYYKDSGKYREEERLVLYITGNVETENWRHKTQPVSYYDLAQHVQNILQKSGVTNLKQETINDQLLEYGLKLSRGNEEIGKLGKVKSALLKDFGVKQEIFYAELNTSLLFQAANPKLVIKEVVKFPEVRRDLSLVLDKQVNFNEINNVVLSTEKRLIKNIIAFDVYEGENIPPGKKAYALGFTLLDETKTLTDEEIDKTMNRLIKAFEEKLGAVIRK